MTNSSDKRTNIFYFFAVIALASILVFFYFNTEKVKSTNKLVDHSNEVRMMNDAVLIDVLNIETAIRGYVLTKNKKFLEPYTKSSPRIHKNLAYLKLLSQDNPEQLLRIKVLSNFIDKRLAVSKRIIEIQNENAWTDDNKKANFEMGKVLTDTIRTIINNINSEELSLLKERRIEKDKVNQKTDLSFSILIFLIVVIFILILFIYKNNKKNSLEKEIFESENKLHSKYSLSLIEASLDPLVTINAEGKITDMNEATVNITGIERDKLVGSDFFDYFTEQQKAREVYQEVFANGSVADSPLTLRHKDGKLTDVLFNGSVYKDDQGKVIESPSTWMPTRSSTSRGPRMAMTGYTPSPWAAMGQPLRCRAFSIPMRGSASSSRSSFPPGASSNIRMPSTRSSRVATRSATTVTSTKTPSRPKAKPRRPLSRGRWLSM